MSMAPGATAVMRLFDKSRAPLHSQTVGPGSAYRSGALENAVAGHSRIMLFLKELYKSETRHRINLVLNLHSPSRH